mgnify:CR=1 FL=1
MNSDHIEKEVILRAPLDRVWRAISNADEFGRWFGVRFDGPFVAGESVTGVITPTEVDDEVAAAFEKLQASQVKIGEALYAQQGAESADAGAESAAPQGDDEDIVDAEVVDEDDEKKA